MRQLDRLALFKSRTNHGKKTFLYRASQLYNKPCAPKQDLHRYSSAMRRKFICVAVGDACFLTIALSFCITRLFHFTVLLFYSIPFLFFAHAPCRGKWASTALWGTPPTPISEKVFNLMKSLNAPG